MAIIDAFLRITCVTFLGVDKRFHHVIHPAFISKEPHRNTVTSWTSTGRTWSVDSALCFRWESRISTRWAQRLRTRLGTVRSSTRLRKMSQRFKIPSSAKVRRLKPAQTKKILTSWTIRNPFRLLPNRHSFHRWNHDWSLKGKELLHLWVGVGDFKWFRSSLDEFYYQSTLVLVRSCWCDYHATMFNEHLDDA